jgi:hypothetical protein
MGCDIHIYRERKIADKWVTCEQWEAEEYDGVTQHYVNFQSQREFRDRNYDLFGALCSGVRREFDFSFAERGMPLECAEETSRACEQYGDDGHSHSYLYLHELRDFSAWLSRNTMPIRGVKDRAELAALRASIATGKPDWNLIYPYAQSAWGGDYEEFTFDVPASFGIGESLDKIIKSFDGIDALPHELRMVFWFDN